MTFETCTICGTMFEQAHKCFRCGKTICERCYDSEGGLIVCHRCSGKKQVKGEYIPPKLVDFKDEGIEDIG